jgi:hypothetical protein
MQKLRDNGLTIALLLLFAISILGQWVAGWHVSNEEAQEQGRPILSLAQYAVSAHFLSSVFENWESEFLQMSTYVVLTAMLFQRGSAESRDPDDMAPRVGDAAPTAAADATRSRRESGWLLF